jgi:hypothetical protein
MIKHQVHSNAFVYLLVYGQSDLGFPIWRCPIIFMDVAMREHRTFDSVVLGVAKFTNLIPLLLLISYKL